MCSSDLSPQAVITGENIRREIRSGQVAGVDLSVGIRPGDRNKDRFGHDCTFVIRYRAGILSRFDRNQSRLTALPRNSKSGEGYEGREDIGVRIYCGVKSRYGLNAPVPKLFLPRTLNPYCRPLTTFAVDVYAHTSPLHTFSG